MSIGFLSRFSHPFSNAKARKQPGVNGQSGSCASQKGDEDDQPDRRTAPRDSLASDTAVNNAFFTDALGLRRVKKTVNFDEPSVYHLYWGDEKGSPGLVMTCFPFPHIIRGQPGTGEVGATYFSVPKDPLGFWKDHLSARGVNGVEDTAFGAKRLMFQAPNRESVALVEAEDPRDSSWTGNGVSENAAIQGFSGVSI